MAAVVAWERIVFVGPAGVELGPGRADLAVVDLLARAHLAARRRGQCLRVRLCPDLAALVELAGLTREVGGQPEGGEQVGVEEGVEPTHPVT